MITQLIEVLIGLTLIFVIFSSIATALMEAVEMVRQKRGMFLETGIGEILRAVSGQSSGTDVKAFYDSPFISSLYRGAYQSQSKMLPSYIPAERFADAVLQLAREKRGATFEEFVKRMREAVNLGPDVTDLEQIKLQTIRYYKESMERVSGWYQRDTRRWLILICFCIAALANVDTLQIMNTLSQDDTLREQVVEGATRQASESMVFGPDNSLDQQRAHVERQLKIVDSLGLPIGWTQPEVCAVFRWTCPDPSGISQPPDESGWIAFLAHAPFWSKVFGLLLTTFALTFGAQMWFDLLNQLVNLRSSVKPKATESDETTVASDTAPGAPPAAGSRTSG